MVNGAAQHRGIMGRNVGAMRYGHNVVTECIGVA